VAKPDSKALACNLEMIARFIHAEDVRMSSHFMGRT